eukprot:762434-Hanusia_phi.AAC.1
MMPALSILRRKRSSVVRNSFYQANVQFERHMHDSVSKQMFEVKDAVSNASFSSLFYSSQPIVTSLTRKSVQLFFLIIAAISWKESVHDYLYSRSDGIEYNARMRLTVIELDGEMCAAVTNVHGITLLLDGSPVTDDCIKHEESNSLMLECKDGRGWNSWSMNRTKGTQFPVKFFLEGYDASENNWKVVGSSSFMTYASRHVYFHGKFSPSSKDDLHEFSNKVVFLQYVHMLHPAITGLSMVFVALCGMFGRELWGKRVMAIFGMSRFVVTIVLFAAGLIHPPQNGDKSITYHMMLLLNGMFTVSFIANVKQEKFLASLLNTGIMLTASSLVLSGYAHRGFYSPAISLGLYGSIILVFPVFIICYRLAMSFRAHSLVCNDKKAYDAVWATVEAQQGEPIFQLMQLVNVVQESMEGDYFQYSKKAFETEKKLEVSLDDLYDAAREVLPLLRSKVIQLAAVSGGILPVQIVDGGVHYMKIIHQSALELFWVKWASLKSRWRSMEKIVRTYSGDVYKLTDVARQAIIFHSLNELILCLQTLQDDPEVVIVRIKNRLDPGHVSWQTAGYRDLMLKLSHVMGTNGMLSFETFLGLEWKFLLPPPHLVFVGIRGAPKAPPPPTPCSNTKNIAGVGGHSGEMAGRICVESRRGLWTGGREEEGRGGREDGR